MRQSWAGFAATGIVWLGLAGIVGGAAPAAAARPSAASGDQRAALLAASARDALAQGNAAMAVRDAEAAASILPRDAATRAFLGRAYLSAGRFASAETALRDALTLDPSLGRIAVNRALAQIALGQNAAALASLEMANGLAPEAEIGLALALLGHADEARERLLAAARMPGADARTRQNLAFACAMEGRWNDAATIAAQDVPADRLAERLRRWAMVTQMKADPALQVGALLGVMPAEDSGQPLALALSTLPDASDVPATAVAETVSIIPTTQAGPAGTAGSTPSPLSPAVAQAASMRPVARSVAPRPVQSKLATSVARPVRSVPRKPPLKSWAVQLGAFTSASRIEAAWTGLGRRAQFLKAHVPTGSGFRRGRAMLYRLSVSGFARRGDATRLCLSIKAVGGACFVRSSAGERPMQWAQRNGTSGRA
ncbi:SPOR domain-containing protein [Rhizorhabdus argentea]|uniref:SPOR domain-containing protein n=1 Tax=Rhizorhabdus argentea TaxID=1387174 RepID=UPI0030EB15F9